MDTNQEATAVVQAREMMIKIKLLVVQRGKSRWNRPQAGQSGLDEGRDHQDTEHLSVQFRRSIMSNSL